jgi:serine phosphatase RsbU (regulator of sigma subunit)
MSMAQSHPVVPKLEAILRPVNVTDAGTTVREVVEIFQKDPALLALPVAFEGRFLGIINRRTLFFHHLGRPFAMELHGKRPIRELLDERHVAMRPEWDINDALARLLEADPALATDSFPIVAGERCIGIVAVSELMMKISQNQTQLLATLHGLSARIREEVDKASKIQHDLLPPAECRFDGLSVSAGVVTSSEIGGDFYDYISLDNGRLILVVADVSGHGVQSGMVTTAAKASLHTLIDRGITTPAELLRGMNNAILATARQALLMTCLVAVIDQKSGTLTFANAGHNFPYLYRKEPDTLAMITDVAGYPLGFQENCACEECTLPFMAGDTLFLYTDGIVECRDPNGEEFGYGRLEAVLRGQMNRPPIQVKNRVLEAATHFTRTRSFEDDVTLLITTFQPGTTK